MLTRRQVLARAAGLGVASAISSARPGRANVLAAQLGANRVRWVSPRGTIDVLDDYAYWVALRLGYFGDIRTTLEPGPIEARAATTTVSAGQADMAYPLIGVFSSVVEEGIPLISVFQMGAYDAFDFAFPPGGRPDDLRALEDESIALGSASWQSITDPILAQAGVDISRVSYLDAGPDWGQVLARGQAAAALAWEGIRAQWRATGLDFDYFLGFTWSRFPTNSFVIRRADLDDPATLGLYQRYLRGWAMGLEFGQYNPRAATQIVFEARPALNADFPDKSVAVESLWELVNLFRGDWPSREGWGWHSVDDWDLYLRTARDIGQLEGELNAGELLTNDLVAGANDFDRARVMSDAVSFELTGDFAMVAPPGSAATKV